MSAPSMPENNRDEAINALLNSIAQEETALANLLDAETEIVKSIELIEADIKDVHKCQDTLLKIIQTAAKMQMLLLFKLEKVENIIKIPPHPKPKLACIKTKKIYQSCRKVQMNEDTVDLSGTAAGMIKSVHCKDVELVTSDAYPFTCKRIDNTTRARVSFYYIFSFTYFDEEGTKTYISQPIHHQAVVYMGERIKEKGMSVQCDVFLNCVKCFVSGTQQITCCISKLMVFSLTANVHLMVHETGFCPEPDLCPSSESKCPEFKPAWNPYPEPF